LNNAQGEGEVPKCRIQEGWANVRQGKVPLRQQPLRFADPMLLNVGRNESLIWFRTGTGT
jgi:hypothetical protein